MHHAVVGTLHTMHGPTPEASRSRAQALLWRGDRIVAVGTEAAIVAEARSLGARVRDLEGRAVLPGFVDAHTHFLHVGVKTRRPDLRGATSLESCLALLRDWLKANPGATPVIGEGWDESGWRVRRRPTRRDVDEVLAGLGQARPVVLRRVCGHIAIAGSAALPLVQARWGGDLVDAETGTLLEQPALYLNEVLPASPRELDQALQHACRVALSKGVTTVGDYSQAPYRAALQRAAAAGSLSVRVASSIYVQQLEDALRTGFRTGRRAAGPGDLHTAPRGGTHDGVEPIAEGTSPWLRDGGLKVFLDGSLGARTAALRAPYLDAQGIPSDCGGLAGAPAQVRAERGSRHGCVGHPHPQGTLNWGDRDVARLFGRAHSMGIQVHAHAIGDAAIDQALDAFEGLKGSGISGGHPGSTGPKGSLALRHRIEHYEIVHDAQARRTAALGVVASSQPNFVGTWSAKGGMYEERLGERFHLNNRFQTLRRLGVQVAFGSDGMPFGPLEGLQAAVEHPLPQERLPIEEAVWHYTWMAAWSLHWEHDIGSLAPGKHADFVVLDQGDLGGAPSSWRILETIVGGVTHKAAPVHSN